jgi:hypothetical protein
MPVDVDSKRGSVAYSAVIFLLLNNLELRKSFGQLDVWKIGIRNGVINVFLGKWAQVNVPFLVEDAIRVWSRPVSDREIHAAQKSQDESSGSQRCA